MSKVEVLCPNGHRVSVKVNQNTKILQILEETCVKQGYFPSSEYELKHGRKILDSTLSVQYAAIPNLAKLELVKSVKSRTESVVVIALQLADGQRLQMDCMPPTTLWDMLCRYEEHSSCRPKLTTAKGEHPVCIYMKDEIIGEYALRRTSLRTLGLTGGRAIIRHTFRSVSNDVLQEIQENLERENERLAKLASRARESFQSVSAMNQQQSLEGASTPQFTPEFVVNAEPVLTSSVSNVNSPTQLMETDGGQSVSMTGSSFGLMQEPLLPGYQHVFQTAYQSPFTEFKFPEETKGKDLYRNELSEVNFDDLKPCNREMVVYSLDEPRPESRLCDEDIPNEFFEVTESDIRKIWSDLQKQSQDISDQPLLTQSLRKAQMEAKMSRYKHVILRIQFPDRLMMQAIFRSQETVFVLYKFIKEQLDNRNLEFELYTTPPKVTLKDQSLTLVEANLAPMTVVYFGSTVRADHYLSASVLSSLSHPSEADKVLVKFMPPTPETSSTGLSQSSSSTRVTEASSTSVPKWFQSGRK